MLDAYEHGIFPWPVDSGKDGLAWWSPDPRAILTLADFHVPRRLARTLSSGRFVVTFDQAFEHVVQQCASVGDRKQNMWITPEIIDAYRALHEQGYAHSVEVWKDGALSGGLYGVCLGSMFAGESMFSNQRDASKVALVSIVQRLIGSGCTLFDIQIFSQHLSQFGAIEISRHDFMSHLTKALTNPHCWPTP